jgi:cytochrome c
MKKTLALLALPAAAALVALPARAVDEAAAQALLKTSGCMKCHAVSAQKEGPSFKETAAKYKGQPDAEAKLVAHLTTQKDHAHAKTDNEADVKNLVQWILAQ